MISIGDERYVFEAALSNRGQPGMAGFYQSKDTQKSYLIKEDDPGTCFAESLAITHDPFTQTKEPDRAPIIQASIGVMEREGKPPTTVSIQDKFIAPNNDKVMPFDLYVFGRRRVPKALVSDEYMNQKTISEKIGALSDEVKMQLARAIYISQLNGDESLHVGQFMISVNKAHEVTSIARIDFGALGRYAESRTKFDVLRTSKQYAESGQFRKDYVSYLLQDKNIQKKVIDLWKQTNVPEVINKMGKRFSEQVNKLNNTLDLKSTALGSFSESLSKKNSQKNHNPLSEKTILKRFITAAKKHCDGYKENSLIAHNLYYQRYFKENLKSSKLQALQNISTQLKEDSPQTSPSRKC